MVSAAKLRRAQEAIVAQRPYALGLRDLTRKLASKFLEEADLSSLIKKGFLRKNPLLSKLLASSGVATLPVEVRGGRRLLLVVITLDRGLCGSFNSNVLKKAQTVVDQVHREQRDQPTEAEFESLEIAVVGKKGFEYFKRQKPLTVSYFDNITGKVSLAKAKELAETLLQRYLSGEFTDVRFVYNEFVNALTQRVVIERFLPLSFEIKELQARSDLLESADAGHSQPAILLEPSLGELLESLIHKSFQMQVFRILLESQAGEHGARMSAMDNATKNADEMIRKLSLQYNKQRQTLITKELLEIISGSESQRAV